MRAFEAEFAEHLQSGATTLATCWRVERTDEVVLGFTDHDEALSFAGTVFAPTHGLEGGEASARLGAQVDTGEVLGVLSGDAIADDDIRLGRFDGATVETWRVNWRDPGIRALLRRDTIGEIVREDGIFRAELRSGQHALNVPQGQTYGVLCDAELGDARCGVNRDDPAFRAAAVVVEVLDRFRVQVSGLSGFEANWFSFGVASWGSGARVGKRDRVVEHRREGHADILTFDGAAGDWVGTGDGLTITAGCDRRFASCREKFGNTVNFRGFPHIPGNDFILRYPRPGNRSEGEPLFR